MEPPLHHLMWMKTRVSVHMHETGQNLCIGRRPH